jgi:CSLREA domain-containing protein
MMSEHLGACALLASTLLACVPSRSHAATFTVNTTVDDDDAALGDGQCATSSGACTLRAAIQEANSLSGGDAVIVRAGSYQLTLGQLEVTDDLTITGAGEASTVIDGKKKSRVLRLTYPADVTLSQVTIKRGRNLGSNGCGASAGDAGCGGGLLNESTATLTNVTFIHNEASDGGGFSNLFGTATLTNVTFAKNKASGFASGGLDNFNGIVTLTNVVFTSNTAPNAGGLENIGEATLTNVTFIGNKATDRHIGAGGGLWNSVGTVTLSDVTFTRNKTNTGSLAGGGGFTNESTAVLSNVTFTGNEASFAGGLLNFGTATLSNVTFSKNKARQDGGGIDNGGTATLTGVIFTGNKARANGGGLTNASTGTAELTNVLLTGNTAKKDGGLINNGSATLTNVTVAGNKAGFNAGGIENFQGTLTLINTIVSGQTTNCLGAMRSLGHNLDSGDTCGFTAAGDLVNIDPLLPKTPPLMPSAGSLAIDAGDDSACPATDLRGVPRPQGAACDIGAYEVQP